MIPVLKVSIPLTLDPGPFYQAKWEFGDEITAVTGNPFQLAIDGNEVVDWDWAETEYPAPNYIVVSYAYPVNTDDVWSINAAISEVTFENGDNGVIQASGGVQAPKGATYRYQFSADENMDNGPAALVGIKTNHLTLSEVTLINVYITDLDGHDLRNEFPAWAFRSGSLKIKKVGSSSINATYAVLGVTDPQYVLTDPPQPDTGYRQIAVTSVDAHGSLAADDFVTLEYVYD